MLLCHGEAHLFSAVWPTVTLVGHHRWNCFGGEGVTVSCSCFAVLFGETNLLESNQGRLAWTWLC